MAAHAIRPLRAPGTSAFALVLLALGHATGWPVARGGSRQITAAMRAYLESLGGSVECDHPIATLAELPPSRAVLFDVTPRQLLAICGDALPARYRGALERFKYGAGVFKVDYALSGPVPWTGAGGPQRRHRPPRRPPARDRRVRTSGRARQALEQAVRARRAAVADRLHARAGRSTHPVGLLPRPQRLDARHDRARSSTRSSASPPASASSCSPARRAARQLEQENPNYIGGDINGGAASLRQVLARPTLSANPYATPDPRLLLCSSSTPPGGGVHGMCGFHAARAALRGPLR